jgi:uncharacterized membrane-anchored protein
MRQNRHRTVSRMEKIRPAPLALHYAVAAGMLGALAQGDAAGAREIWMRHGHSIRADDDLLLRVLVARTAAR